MRVIAVLLLAVGAGCVFVLKAGDKSLAKISEAVTRKPPFIFEEQIKVKCDTQAYRRGLHNDEIPTATNIRSQPNKNSVILKSISTTDEVVFSITGSSSGWFEISSVETVGTDDDKILFKGAGWVHSSQLDLSVANSDPKLYSAPKTNSRILKKLIADESPAEPLACQGKWMKVKSGKLTGWLSPGGQCANPLTTCS